jgi:hypothetical protein
MITGAGLFRADRATNGQLTSASGAQKVGFKSKHDLVNKKKTKSRLATAFWCYHS